MYINDYENPFKPRNPFKARMSDSLKNFFIILGVVVFLGGGIFGITYMVLDSGYGACLIVRCVKIIP